MTAHDPPMAIFDFLDLPKELRLMVYELLPVARIHREINNTLNLVVIWSPACVLHVSRLINEEASAIVKGTVEVYKKARENSAFNSTLIWDLMPKLLVRTQDCWTAHCDFDDVPSILMAALWREDCLANGIKDLPEEQVATLIRQRSTQDNIASRYIAEWAQHACRLLCRASRGANRSSQMRQFDIAVITSNDEQFNVLISQQCLFEDGLLSDPDFLLDMDGLVLEESERFVVNFTIVPPDRNEEQADFCASVELASGVTMHGCCLSAGEWIHMWAEAEWL